MKNILKKLFPTRLLEFALQRRDFYTWKKGGYLDNSPQLVKQNVFLKYGVKGASWVETGTYLGTTTHYLSNLSHHVYSLEPEQSLYRDACKRFEGKNVTLFNDTSENVLPSLLPKLDGDINFWLDGHYSEGMTFKGLKDCPVEEELAAIEANFNNFSKISILIDDARCFLPSEAEKSDYPDYPSIDYLVDWARRMNMQWRIEQDIFIMQKH